MNIVKHSQLQTFSLPGLTHQTLASRSDDLREVEVWMQQLEPGAATPVHQHECEEVVVVLRGSGTLTIANQVQAFGPNSTLIIPPKIAHQIVNSSAEALQIIAVLSETPARVFTADGDVIGLPWSA
jgi:mannose-6-phosphate isomerase-like protein (cupin superfamily)